MKIYERGGICSNQAHSMITLACEFCKHRETPRETVNAASFEYKTLPFITCTKCLKSTKGEE